LHAGLVILSRVVQRRLFKAALDELATIDEPVNRVREVNLAGDAVRLTLYELPPGSAPSHVSQFFFNRVDGIRHRERLCLALRSFGSAAAVRVTSGACAQGVLAAMSRAG
jgi:hypothetical protein